MRYKGLLGEFKIWAFVVWIVLFLALALFTYSRFTFKSEPQPEQLTSKIDSARSTAKQAQETAEALRVRVDTIQNRVEQLERTREKRAKPTRE